LNLKPLFQDDAWNTLRSMAHPDPLRLPGSIIFLGPEGVGKKRTARALFQLIHCLQPAEFEACGACRTCMLVANGNHVDLVEVEPKGSTIHVEELREVLKSNAFRPYEGRIRLILIDQAHLLGVSAANVLLKSLEEPPEYVKFVLITHERTQLLPTITSRSQFVYFRPLEEAAIWEIAERQSLALPSELKGVFSALLGGGLARLHTLAQADSLEFLKKARQWLQSSGQGGRRSWQETVQFADQLSALSDEQWTALFALASCECLKAATDRAAEGQLAMAYNWAQRGLRFSQFEQGFEANANKKLVALLVSQALSGEHVAGP